jgi:isopentenyldiphosphate isomerase
MSQDEQVTVSPVGSPAQLQSYDRGQFYEEQFAGNYNLAIHVIDILLFTSHGDIILQKRSHTKAHNPGILDKSIGGHIAYGDTADYTVMVESVQELLTPSIVLKNDTDFNKTLGLLKNYTETISIVKPVETVEWTLNKSHDGSQKPINNVVHMYFGLYDGRMRPADREAAGMLYYSYDNLKKEIEHNPMQFTDDLVQMCSKYNEQIIAFQNLVNNVMQSE